MNKKIVVSTFLLGILVVFLAYPKTSLAFWPFDFLKKSQVKGEQSQNVMPNFFQKMIQSLKLKTGETQLQEGQLKVKEKLEARLTKAVSNGKLTEEQKTEILNQVAAIRTKRQELRQLELDLLAWFKTNNLNPMSFGLVAPPPPKQGGQMSPVNNPQSSVEPSPSPEPTIVIEE